MTAASQISELPTDQRLTGLRVSLRIMEKWHASEEDTCRILRISRSTYRRAKQSHLEHSTRLDSDQLQRISLVLNIHAALRKTFDNPANVYGFPGMTNRNDFFNGRSPVEIMAKGDMISLYETFRRIDALKNAHRDDE